MYSTDERKGALVLCISLLATSVFMHVSAEGLRQSLEGDQLPVSSSELEQAPVVDEDDVWTFQVVHDNSTTAPTTQNTTVFTLLASTTMVPSPVIHSHCERMLKRLGERASHFTHCSILHARPLGLCSGCISEYTGFMKAYNAVYDRVDPVEGKSCAEVLLASDMTQIVEKTYQFIQSLWDASTCEQCFDIGAEVNGTVDYSLSNTTLHFLRMANKTLLCFAQHSNKTTMHNLETSPDISDDDDDVCRACKKPYNELNALYISLENKEKLCVDIVDSMNSTRHAWSHRFSCLTQQQDIVAVSALAVGLCLLPVFFYLGSKINVEKVEKKLLKQKRFRPLNQPSGYE